MTSRPRVRDSRVVIGAPLYNNSANLPQALDSLLSQTYPDAAYMLIDDCSSDATAEIAATYAERDERVHFETNERRLGLIGTYLRCFERARDLCPSMEYFAWASDHDMWHPRWLGELVRAMDADPGAALAYPRSVGVLDDGTATHFPASFATVGVEDPLERLRMAIVGAPAGYLVYGLSRADLLEDCGVYRPVRDPDRLLMAELSLRGRLIEIPEVLYYRRRTERPNAARQRAACFPDGVPLHVLVPWPLTHAAMLTWGVLGGRAPGAAKRVSLALGAGWIYGRWGLELELHRRLRGRSVTRKFSGLARRRRAARAAMLARGAEAATGRRVP
ncbi:MAG: glycosyltransferase [Thermoleophilaceae bacterium]|nr:glycosyltransferase [Thermoleophilaceae bacterium]